jgi:hypothetical protein
MDESRGRLAKSERGCMDMAVLQDSRYRGVEGSVIYTPAAGDKSEACSREDRSCGQAAQTLERAGVQIPNPTTTLGTSALEKLEDSRCSVSNSSSHSTTSMFNRRLEVRISVGKKTAPLLGRGRRPEASFAGVLDKSACPVSVWLSYLSPSSPCSPYTPRPHCLLSVHLDSEPAQPFS